jgi:hypothetical protein
MPMKNIGLSSLRLTTGYHSMQYPRYQNPRESAGGFAYAQQREDSDHDDERAER